MKNGMHAYIYKPKHTLTHTHTHTLSADVQSRTAYSEPAYFIKYLVKSPTDFNQIFRDDGICVSSDSCKVLFNSHFLVQNNHRNSRFSMRQSTPNNPCYIHYSPWLSVTSLIRTGMESLSLSQVRFVPGSSFRIDLTIRSTSPCSSSQFLLQNCPQILCWV
jgi:hypothetical protein